MVIDLKTAVGYIHRELTRQNVRAVLNDLYPKEPLWYNLLSDVVGCGIVADIQKNPSISKERYNSFVKRITDEYGVREVYAHKALNMWISLYGKLDADVQVIDYDIDEEDIWAEAIISAAKKPVKDIFGDYQLKIISQNTAEIIKFVGVEQDEITVPGFIAGKKIIGVGSNTFAKCVHIRSIIVSEGIQYLGGETFFKCRNLKTVKLPSTLTQLGSGVFSHTAVTDVELPESLTALPEGSFRNCENLRFIKIPGSVNLIADYAFFGCKSLREVIIGDGVEYLGKEIFDGCEKLKSVFFPKSIKMIMGNLKNHLTSSENPTPEKAEEFTVRCQQGSYAMNYAKTRGYTVDNIDGEND